MAKLYFRYGAMGSSKTANALMVAYNYKERGKRALLAKPKLDTREIGVMHSRIGLEEPCIYVEELVQMPMEELEAYDCIIVDEAQFCTKSDIQFFTLEIYFSGVWLIFTAEGFNQSTFACPVFAQKSYNVTSVSVKVCIIQCLNSGKGLTHISHFKIRHIYPFWFSLKNAAESLANDPAAFNHSVNSLRVLFIEFIFILLL